MCIFNKFSRGQIFAQSLLGILLLTACSSPNSQSSTTSTPSASNPTAASDTLKLLYWQAPTILNPHLAQGNKDFEASRITYEPNRLIKYLLISHYKISLTDRYIWRFRGIISQLHDFIGLQRNPNISR